MKNDLQKTELNLNAVGKGFCLAKWTQATLHLGVGLTHSCHHTKAHPIDISKLQQNPSALHNTDRKKADRQTMLAGNWVADCTYCKTIEDAQAGYSDRIMKSSAEWSVVDYEKILNGKWNNDVGFPRSLEVSFSNVCNFACAYCGPTFSSQWIDDIDKNGPYNVGDTFYNKYKVPQIPNKDKNPYIEAFENWLPDIIDNLYELRITGGEPLLSKHTTKVLKMIRSGAYPNLDFAINTNACPPLNKWNDFIAMLQSIEEQKSCRSLTVYVSCESTGAQAGYARDGLDYKMLVNNVENLLGMTSNVKVRFMSTVNILALPSLLDFTKWVANLKEKFGNKRAQIDFAKLKHPDFLDVQYASSVLKGFLKKTDSFLQNNDCFLDREKKSISRIFNSVKHTQTEHIITERFLTFINEYDRRRGYKFAQIFNKEDFL
jgi:hypothetical protein